LKVKEEIKNNMFDNIFFKNMKDLNEEIINKSVKEEVVEFSFKSDIIKDQEIKIKKNKKNNKKRYRLL